jgi:toxin ParE1/3/4
MSAAVLTPRARADLLGAIRWIAKDNKAAAQGLRKAVIAAAERIGDHPGLGVVRPDYTSQRLRFLTLTGYPYVIAYDPELSPPQILRVLHGARDIPFVLRRE